MRSPCAAVAVWVCTGGDIEILVRLLGPFSVRRDGEEVEPTAFGGRLPQTLLRLLATRRGSSVPHDMLVDALWPDRPPVDPVANLNVLASRVRKATGTPWLVRATVGGYVLPANDGCHVDAERFLAEVKDGRRLAGDNRHEGALQVFEAALARWSGEPLVEDLYAEWAQPYRRLLHREHVQALEGAAGAALALGDAVAALQRAEQAVTAEPLRESSHLLRVRALAASGDPAGAADAFAAFGRQLAEETGLEPSAEAKDLHVQLLRGELASAARRTAPAPRRPVADPSAVELPFVGREREVELILEQTRLPGSAVVVVDGVSGVGKSRLLAEIARRAGCPTLSARAFLAERDEAWGLARRLLRESIAADVSAVLAMPERFAVALADVLPEVAELRPVPPLVIEPESRRALAVEGAVRMLAAVVRDGLVLADDLQWADASSLAVLDRLRSRFPDIGMVLAFRPDQTAPGDPLRTFLDDAEHAGPVARVTVDPLAVAAVAELVADDELAGALAEHTDRTPIALVEAIRALAGRGVLGRLEDGRWAPTTALAESLVEDAGRAGQRRVIEQRTASLPGDGRELLRLLATLGRETSARVLADAVGRSQGNLLKDLDGLARAGLARLGERGWAAAHDYVAESVLAGLDRATLGRTHGVLARALIREDADQAEVARHLARAGDTAAANEAYAAAARDRLDRFANREAEQLADAGLALNPKPSVGAELLETRAEARARTGDLAGAGEDLRQAQRAGTRGPARARLLALHARFAVGAEDLGTAAELARLALAEAGGDPRARAAALYAGSIVDMNTDRSERAEERSDEALRLFEQVGDSRGVADILDARAMATFLDGRIQEAAQAFDQVAGLFADAGDLLRVVTPRSTRGHALVFMAEPGRGLADAEEALELARSLDHPEGVSYALWHRSEALAALGRAGEAVSCAEEAVQVAERVGHRSWTVSAHRALGVALQAQGDLEPAELAFHRSLDQATRWPLFTSWSCARIALVRLEAGDAAGAEPYVKRSLSAGPPLAHYEARLARAELAVQRGEPAAADIATDALARAQDGGHLVSVARLGEL